MNKPQCSKTPKKETNENSVEQLPKTAKDLLIFFVDEDSDEKSEKNEPPIKKFKDRTNKKYPQKYRKEWESRSELKMWLSESIQGKFHFYCKLCKTDYRGGISEIQKHMASKKHVAKATAPAVQKFRFTGLLCPVFTPFAPTNRSGEVHEVNYKAIEAYSNYLSACNVKCVLINDVMGEGMSLTTQERFKLIDSWSKMCKTNEQLLLVQIGGPCFKEVIEVTKYAYRKQVDAIVILPDLYCRPRNHLDVIKYMKSVSEYSQQLPIFYHHHPSYTNVAMDVNSFLNDITGEMDSFAGLIYTTNDIQQVVNAMDVNNGRFAIFLGTDEMILSAVVSGIRSIMSPSLNFLPKLVESIVDSIENSNVKCAQKSQVLLSEIVALLKSEGEAIAMFKAATELITATCGCATRQPLGALWEGNVKKLQEKLHEFGVI